MACTLFVSLIAQPERSGMFPWGFLSPRAWKHDIWNRAGDALSAVIELLMSSVVMEGCARAAAGVMEIKKSGDEAKWKDESGHNGLLLLSRMWVNCFFFLLWAKCRDFWLNLEKKNAWSIEQEENDFLWKRGDSWCSKKKKKKPKPKTELTCSPEKKPPPPPLSHQQSHLQRLRPLQASPPTNGWTVLSSF